MEIDEPGVDAPVVIGRRGPASWRAAALTSQAKSPPTRSSRPYRAKRSAVIGAHLTDSAKTPLRIIRVDAGVSVTWWPSTATPRTSDT